MFGHKTVSSVFRLGRGRQWEEQNAEDTSRPLLVRRKLLDWRAVSPMREGVLRSQEIRKHQNSVFRWSTLNDDKVEHIN